MDRASLRARALHLQKLRVGGPTHDQVDLLPAAAQPVQEGVDGQSRRSCWVDPPECPPQLCEHCGNEGANAQEDVVLILF